MTTKPRTVEDAEAAAAAAVQARRAAALKALGRAHRAILDAEDAEVAAVAECRAAGVTWALVADAVNMHQPNAVKKYKPLINETVLVTVEAAPRPRTPARKALPRRGGGR